MAQFHSRFAPALFAIFATGFASFLVAGVATFRAVGFVPSLPQQWLSSWLVAWPVAAPALYLIAPYVRKLVAWLCGPQT